MTCDRRDFLRLAAAGGALIGSGALWTGCGDRNGPRRRLRLLILGGTGFLGPHTVKAALAITPKCAIPMHYGAIVGEEGDAHHFKRVLEGKINVRVLPKE